MTEHVVVLGAGYAGQMAARLAARRTGARVTLVNASDRFVERVRLHQLASGERLPDRPLGELLDGSGVELVVDRVVRVDAERRRVHLGAGTLPLGYDVLVYALGSRADLDAVPGVAEHAYTVADEQGALRLSERLPQATVVAVVGGGLTGLEAATELAESHPGLRTMLITGGAFGSGVSARGRRHLRRTFGRLGIEIRDRAEVAKVDSGGVLLADGSRLDADTVVWTTGFTVSDLAASAGFAVDERGRMVVDAALRSVSHPDVYAVGDAAAGRMSTGQELRMACATGLPSAQHLARSLVDRQAGRPTPTLRFRYRLQCVSLGRRDALIQFVHADDSAEAVLTGRLGALVKETIVRGAFNAQRHPGLPTSL